MNKIRHIRAELRHQARVSTGHGNPKDGDSEQYSEGSGHVLCHFWLDGPG